MIREGARGRLKLILWPLSAPLGPRYEEKAMSSVAWDKDNLVQRVGSNSEELGHVKYDENSNQYVLWLKDTRAVFGSNKGYIRGDSFPSMQDAKQSAAFSTSARLFHYMWLVGLRADGNETNKDIAQGIKDAESGKPLTESTFKEEMEKITAESKKRERWALAIGVGLALVGIAVSFLTSWLSLWLRPKPR